MDSFDKKAHWEKIYTTKTQKEFSWFQEVPINGIRYLSLGIASKNSKIIDVGGGDGFFVDALLEKEYKDISVLDISSSALDRAKKRLGNNAQKVNWIASDILNFNSAFKYDFWYDRAVFHFLTTPEDVKAYVNKAAELVSPEGIMVVGTFSPNGPKKCSGIPIQQYTEKEIERVFSSSFEPLSFEREIHHTPFETQQEFLFTSFRLKP